MVEQLIRNQQVVGSSPISSSTAQPPGRTLPGALRLDLVRCLSWCLETCIGAKRHAVGHDGRALFRWCPFYPGVQGIRPTTEHRLPTVKRSSTRIPRGTESGRFGERPTRGTAKSPWSPGSEGPCPPGSGVSPHVTGAKAARFVFSFGRRRETRWYRAFFVFEERRPVVCETIDSRTPSFYKSTAVKGEGYNGKRTGKGL